MWPEDVAYRVEPVESPYITEFLTVLGQILRELCDPLVPGDE